MTENQHLFIQNFGSVGLLFGLQLFGLLLVNKEDTKGKWMLRQMASSAFEALTYPM